MLDKLDEQEAKLQQEGEAGDIADERLEKIGEALDMLAEKRAAIEEARIVDDSDARATAGAFVVLDHDGKVRIERGLVQRSQKAPRHEPQEAAGEVKKKPKPEFSDALTRRLTAERTLALRAVLAAQPEHALTALVHALVLKEFYNDRHPVICITVRDECHLQRSGIDADKTKAVQSLHALRGELQEALPADAADLWGWIVAQEQATQLRYLAYCIAPSVNAMPVSHTKSAQPVEAVQSLAALLGLDMADWWEATAESFFGSMSKAKLIEAVREIKGDSTAAALDGMKKAGAVTAAAAALEGTRWLPTLLR